MPRKRTVQTSSDDSYVYFKERSPAQLDAIDIYNANDIIFLLGPAGTGKTHVAVYCAIHDMQARIKTHHRNKVILTRPIVEAGEKLGFLPGEIDEKVHPYMLPVYDCIGKMVDRPDEFIARHFECAPLAYMRGRTFEGCTAILDEAQNCTSSQLKLFTTRLGTGSKIIITGDPDQSDIGRRSGLKKVVDAFMNEPGVGVYSFTDEHIVRHPLVAKLLKKWPK